MNWFSFMAQQAVLFARSLGHPVNVRSARERSVLSSALSSQCREVIQREQSERMLIWFFAMTGDYI